MQCARAIQILDAMRGKRDVPVSDEELTELIQLNCIELFGSERTLEDVNADIEGVRNQYNALADTIRQANKEMLSAERERSTGSLAVRIGATFRFGAGKALHQRILQLKEALDSREQDIGLVKKRLLDLSVEKETVERAVRIDGHRALLTPIGERLTGEIVARARFSDSDLLLVTGKLAQLDNAFTSAISRIDAMMRASTFPSIWAPYFVGLGLPGTEMEAYHASQAAMSSYAPVAMDTQFLDYSTTYMLRGVYGSGAAYTGPPNVAQVAKDIFSQVNNMLSARAPAAPAHARHVIGVIAKMLASWSPAVAMASTGATNTVQTEHVVIDANEYLDNLYKMLSGQATASMGGIPLRLGIAAPRDASSPGMDPSDEQDEALAVLLLALSKRPKKYEHFLDTFQSVTHGRKIFAALAALFPWDVQETWMVLLRAESCIQRGQSAKFVPELIEYAILLALNPDVILIEDNISGQQLAAWKYIVIPAIQAAVVGGLEGRIESYIQARPLSYVTYPRYYHHRHLHHTRLHYHTTG